MPYHRAGVNGSRAVHAAIGHAATIAARKANCQSKFLQKRQVFSRVPGSLNKGSVVWSNRQVIEYEYQNVDGSYRRSGIFAATNIWSGAAASWRAAGTGGS